MNRGRKEKEPDWRELVRLAVRANTADAGIAIRVARLLPPLDPELERALLAAHLVSGIPAVSLLLAAHLEGVEPRGRCDELGLLAAAMRDVLMSTVFDGGAVTTLEFGARRLTYTVNLCRSHGDDSFFTFYGSKRYLVGKEVAALLAGEIDGQDPVFSLAKPAMGLVDAALPWDVRTLAGVEAA